MDGGRLRLAAFLLACCVSFPAGDCYDCGPYDFCERVLCSPVEECEDGVMVEGGGVCACCPVCLKFLDLEAECEPDENLPVDLGTLVPPGDTSRVITVPFCNPRYRCLDGKCAVYGSDGHVTFYDPVPPQCFLLHDVYEINTEESVQTRLWAWEPKCDVQGHYLTTQCKGDVDDRRCYCVGEAGNTIFGRDFSTDHEMTCGCSRAADLLEKEPVQLANLPFVRCNVTGDYEALQCSDGKCFCVNVTTGRILGITVPQSIANVLPCYDEKRHGGGYYTDCEKETLRLTKVRKDLLSKGVSMVVEEEPKCDPDGSYAPRQCVGPDCFCADRKGTKLKQYTLMANNVAAAVMMCKCARDEYDAPQLPDGAKKRQCTAKGDYDVYQCQGGLCYCVDDDGQQTSDARKKGSEAFCQLHCVQDIELDINTNPCMMMMTTTPAPFRL